MTLRPLFSCWLMVRQTKAQFMSLFSKCLPRTVETRPTFEDRSASSSSQTLLVMGPTARVHFIQTRWKVVSHWFLRLGIRLRNHLCNPIQKIIPQRHDIIRSLPLISTSDLSLRTILCRLSPSSILCDPSISTILCHPYL